MLVSLYAYITGFILDLLFGDPHWMFFHPVRLIGNMVSGLEKVLRYICQRYKNNSNGSLLAAGFFLVIITASVSFAVPFILLYICWRINHFLFFVVESILCYFLLAVRSLKDESMKVYYGLQKKDIKAARYAVSMIVGRDTERLDGTGIAKAAVETIAENTSDGVIAPMFYMVFGGVPLGYLYKAVNTMDSMAGYKNEKYLFFGRCAAKTDDVFNYIPSRLSALFMIVAAFILPGFNGRNSLKVYKKDRKKSESPNSAQTESVCAGALGVELLGDAYYSGKLHNKPVIGSGSIAPVHIKKANRLLYATSFIGMAVFCILELCILIIAGGIVL